MSRLGSVATSPPTTGRERSRPGLHNPTAHDPVRARAPGPYHAAHKPLARHLLVRCCVHPGSNADAPQDNGHPVTQALASGEPNATD
jgi:hypothetical protein